MIPWIQVYSNLATHRKTGIFADALGLTSPYTSPDVLAVGILVSLWTWAIQNATDGDLSKCSARAIAEACRWKKKPEALLSALREAGFLDPDGKLHDWEEYTLLFIEQNENRKEKTKERVRRYRDRKKTDGNADVTPQDAANDEQNVTPCNADVTVTGALPDRYGNADVIECNASTRQNETKPNNSIYLSGARAREEQKNDFVENSVENIGRKQYESARKAQERFDIEQEQRKPVGPGRVVMLSENQVGALLEKLSLEEFDHYVEVIAKQEMSGKHYRKTHYQAILDMAEQDRKT